MNARLDLYMVLLL